MIIVDALRESFIDGEFINYVGDYIGYRMQLFKDLNEKGTTKDGSEIYLKMFTAIADMPTVTNQRIKAISTGTLPSLFDMGGNIAADAVVVEDSLIHQAKAMNKTIRLYGDDFWIGQYPDGFDDFEVFPSLDVTNLNSNDEIVKRRLLEQMQKDDWDILWTHALGIDHAGHTFNELGEGLSMKLKDIEGLLKEVIDNLRSDMTLAIVSDHGLTKIGSHGGNTEGEVYTFNAFIQKDIPFFDDENIKSDKKLKIIPQTSI